MKYFFVLGSNPAISVAEILSCLSEKSPTVVELSRQILIIESQLEIDEQNLMSQLGGTIKIGRLINHCLPIDVNALADVLADELQQKHQSGKIKFGFSVYSLAQKKPEIEAIKIAKRLHRAGMEIKRRLTDRGLTARWIRPKSGSALSSVIADKEGLVSTRSEFVLLVKSNSLEIGVTDVVQPFELFSETDFGRPGRDAYRGMLPPKVARMMLNLAGLQTDSIIWDPFCGSGTVATEALRLGATSIFASDISPKAITDTKHNIDWLKKNNYIHTEANINVFSGDACRRPTLIGDHSVDLVVSEVFLGPPRRGKETKKELMERLDQLTELYRSVLLVWQPLLVKRAHLVLALPLYIIDSERLGLNIKRIIGSDYKIDPILPAELLAHLDEKLAPDGRVTYGRLGQLVWREIIRLRIK
ncbi:50S ribosomal protein L11 methyltransferase [Patescibacteria group bacterium]|nr:50S ribosomal protein L11 methyltransferase [Patescibacteria group bacterium]MBU1029037.1 50S ribosomal protein L11 methyltransferase [Patescibacteria group bacterium]MBU1915652.1 50S ribosomal protein L11 methyltransferase [Patescibacteria group bacterium]